eukprot:SAG25_NODE_1408_length_3100_cov_1.806065_3_plen_73_part_00
MPRRKAMMAWGGEGAYWAGTSHFKFSKELSIRSALVDLVRLSCTVTDASTNPAAGQVWLTGQYRTLCPTLSS